MSYTDPERTARSCGEQISIALIAAVLLGIIWFLVGMWLSG